MSKKLKIGLVACTKSKFQESLIPKEIYMKSSLFKKVRKYCELYHDKWFILSAKYHLLDPDGDPIDYYDLSLYKFKKSERKGWSTIIFNQLKERKLLSQRLIIHAGKRYYEELIPLLKAGGVDFNIVTESLGIGKKLSWYKQKIENFSK